jgi:hypothetical protein
VVVAGVVADRVAVDDELGVLLAVHDRLALHVTRPMPGEKFQPGHGQPAEATVLVMMGGEDHLAGHAGPQPVADSP